MYDIFATSAATIALPCAVTPASITAICAEGRRCRVMSAKWPLCAVVNFNLCLAERGVAMAIVTVLSPGNIKTTFRLSFFFFLFVTDSMERLWTCTGMPTMYWKSNGNNNNRSLCESLQTDPVGHWCLRWCSSCLLLVRCGFWTPSLTLGSPLFLCFCDLLFGTPQSGWGRGKDGGWCGRGDGCVRAIQG